MCYMVLEPGTWADWTLVIVSLIGGVVAYRTLSALKKQTQQAAKETILLNRAYLQIDSWMPSTAFFTEANGSQGADCTIKFRIFNYSKTAARIEEIELNYKGSTEKRPIGRILVANTGSWETLKVRTKAGDTFRLDGVITYRDVFRKLRHRSFAQMILVGPQPGTEDVEGVGANDELEWNQD